MVEKSKTTTESKKLRVADRKDTEQDLMMPESRSMLPDNHNELFGVSTNAFIIQNEDIKKEKVLGSKFEKEVAQGRQMFQKLNTSKDPRVKAMDALIDDIE